MDRLEIFKQAVDPILPKKYRAKMWSEELGVDELSVRNSPEFKRKPKLDIRARRQLEVRFLPSPASCKSRESASPAAAARAAQVQCAALLTRVIASEPTTYASRARAVDRANKAIADLPSIHGQKMPRIRYDAVNHEMAEILRRNFPPIYKVGFGTGSEKIVAGQVCDKNTTLSVSSAASLVYDTRAESIPFDKSSRKPWTACT